MACNYADGLSPYENKGKLGVPEVFDDEDTVGSKVATLVQWVREANHVVVHTGAGISTSAGIPDFRGPNGVWTLEKRGEKPDINTSFETAVPTPTHMGLTALVASGHVKYVISQNIDGLHLRSGLKRSNISELHGNMFVARCSFCERECVLPTAVPTVGQKEIGEECPWVKHGGRGCRGKLKDNILDWEHNLPERDLEMADIHSTAADLSICLGTTLQIVPAGNLPLRAKKNGGKLVIVNLQPTKHHKKADLVVHTYVDKVISGLASMLGVSIPTYSEDWDPSSILRNSKLLPLSHVPIDWTISASSITKMKKTVASSKDTKPKPKNPSSTRRKRKRRRRLSDSCSEDEFQLQEDIDIKPKPPCTQAVTSPTTEVGVLQPESIEEKVKIEVKK